MVAGNKSGIVGVLIYFKMKVVGRKRFGLNQHFVKRIYNTAEFKKAELSGFLFYRIIDDCGRLFIFLQQEIVGEIVAGMYLKMTQYKIVECRIGLRFCCTKEHY